MDLERLRSETAADHDEVESCLPVMEEDLALHAYVSMLQRLYGFVLGWEMWAETSSSDRLRELMVRRKRSALLCADLTHFCATAEVALYSGPGLSTECEAEVLGAMYVMEGSTLGGQHIARYVERHFAFEPGRGDAFFRGYGDRTGAMWLEIKEALKDLPESEAETVIRSAKVMFTDFFDWNRTTFCREI